MTKKYQVIILPSAKNDLKFQYEYIYQNNPAAAEKWEAGIRQTIKKLTHLPERHPIDSDAKEENMDVRRALYGKNTKWIIYFSIIKNTVFVMHIKHQRQKRQTLH